MTAGDRSEGRYPDAIGSLVAAAQSLAKVTQERDEARAVIAEFVGRRPEYVRALKASPDADSDYWRWQGHAEARRQLCEQLTGQCQCGYHKERTAP